MLGELFAATGTDAQGARLTVDDIASRVWTFGFADGAVYSRNIVLAADGRFLHHGSPNEHSWSLEGERLHLFAASGEVSAMLSRVESADGLVWFEGEHVLRGPSGLHLALRETGVIYPVHLPWSSAIEDFIASVPIYLSGGMQNRSIYRAGQIVTVPARAIVEPFATLPRNYFIGVGAYSYMHGQFASSPTRVGRYCSIAGGSRVLGPAHPVERVSTSPFSYDDHYVSIAAGFGVPDYATTPYDQTPAPTTIGNDVWIGEDVLVKGGVEIGHGAVLGARSMVTKDVPPYAIVVGTPARILRFRFPAELIESLLETRWWEYNFCDLPRKITDPAAFVSDLRQRRDSGAITPWRPRQLDLALELLRI